MAVSDLQNCKHFVATLIPLNMSSVASSTHELAPFLDVHEITSVDYNGNLCIQYNSLIV